MFIADYQTMRAGGGEDEQPTTATSDLGGQTDRQTDIHNTSLYTAVLL